MPAILRLRDCPARPWKNGLGRTRELAVEPANAGTDDFLWRASVAEVDSAAPFSAFPGIDRTIVLLEGEGFTMALDDGRNHALTTPYAPFAFPGEAQVSVTLAGGATRDFNLMLRRGCARGHIAVWSGAGTPALAPDLVLLYCARGRVTIDGTGLDTGDAWRRQASMPAAVVLDETAVVLAVCVQADGGD